MEKISDYTSDWMRAKQEQTNTLRCLDVRISTVEDELERLLDRYSLQLQAYPYWSRYVVEPILRRFKDLYIIQVLPDATAVKVAVKLFDKGSNQSLQHLYILFERTEEITGEFTITTVANRSDGATRRRNTKYDDFLTVERLIKKVESDLRWSRAA